MDLGGVILTKQRIEKKKRNVENNGMPVQDIVAVKGNDENGTRYEQKQRGNQIMSEM